MFTFFKNRKKKGFILILIGLCIFFTNGNCFSQSGDIPNNNDVHTGSNASVEKNGNELINQSFSFTECGLDYVIASNKVTDRVSYPTGTSLPSGLSISGIPAGATIVKALLYWAITVDLSGTPNFSINGQAGIADLIGTGTEKCWYPFTLYNDPNYVATDLVTQNYRADVTSMITGNGVYSVNLNDWSRLVDGLGIVVVYKQSNQAWEGTLVINDGCNTLDHNNNLNEFLPTVSPCVDACNVKTFSIVSDFATQSGDSDHFYSFAGGALISKNDLFFQIDEFINPFPLSAGTQTIAYNIKSAMYLPSTDCFNLEANGLYFRTYSCSSCADNMIPTVVIDDASCGLCDGSATLTPNGGMAPFTVQWNPGIATGTNLFSVSNLCEGDYSYILSDNSGCISFTDSFSVDGTPAFQVDTVLFHETECAVCNGFIDVLISTPPSTLTYSLNLNNVTIASQVNNGHFSDLCAGTYELTVLDDSGCSYNQTIIISQTSTIVIDSLVTTIDNGCLGNCNGSISVFPNSGLTYSNDGGTNWQNSSVFNQVCSGNYTVIIQDNFGCTNTQTISVDSSPLQVVGGNDFTLCENGSTSIGISVSGGQSPYFYNWSPSNGNNDTILVSPSMSQQYTVFVTDGLGCQSDTVEFNSTVLPPITITDLQDIYYCADQSTLINSSVSGGNGNYSYQWIDSASLQVLGTNSSINFSLSGIGTVYLLVEDDCTSNPDTISFNYVEESQPVIQLISSNLNGCPPFSTTLSLNNSPLNSSLSWTIEGQSFTTTSPNLDYLTETIGCQNVNLEMVSESGCTFSYGFNQVFCVSPLPIADFNYSPTALTTLNSSVNLTNLSDPTNTSFWTISPNAHLSNVSEFSPIVSFAFSHEEQIEVCLFVTDSNGCASDVCQTITVDKELLLYIPNCFTPDDNDFNDVFLPIINLETTDSYHFMVFDRWGTIIFETRDPSKGWNGSYLGKQAQDGVYVWKVEIPKAKIESNREIIGHVSLLR